tara:strand:+ start:6700 stop:6900 length:201 start_codon:yes stop_codon:yes gene_type:complete
MAISNEIFESYRIQERAQEQLKAIELLVKQGYIIIDLENQIIDRDGIRSLRYDRTPKSIYLKTNNK